MKRFVLTLAAFASCAAAAAQSAETAQDSLRLVQLQAVEVSAIRAKASTPVAYADLSGGTIARHNFGLDIPSILTLTPSMIATNETGIGIGGTSMRLRGTDATRLNVTVNGVSLNNPDSHAMYWYDTPDLISSVGSMQVQRGAGISTNGTGAFGGAISMTTDALASSFNGDASLSYGSYNTNKQAVHIGSGLLGGRWVVDARLTHIGSDGYIDRGSTDLLSYMFQTGFYSGSTMLKFVSFGGKSKTYLTYNGVSKADMEQYGRRYHTSGQYVTADGQVAYYDDQTDNYLQFNNQLILSQQLTDRWTLNATAFYTYGYGYYKQYKDDAWLAGYLNLQAEVEQADLIREKLMRNHLFGVQGALAYAGERADLDFGGSWSEYRCPHWGTLDWVEGVAPSGAAGRWYDNDVRKQDANLFARADWTVARNLHLFADLQYRYVHYKAWGVNDNFDWNRMAMQPIEVNETYHFLNPHFGLSYLAADRHHLYASVAVSHKEPTRSDFTDRHLFAADDANPKHETLIDFELGYRYTAPRLSLGVNLYYMRYKDQLVPTGLVNDGDDALNTNVPDSYRAGVELTAAWQAARWLTLAANATFSRNRIENYVDLLKDSPTYGQTLGDRKIAYAPDAMGAISLDFHHKGFEAILHTRCVGKQYFTNNEIEALSLDAYCVTDLNLGYTLRLKSARSVRFGVALYNLFSTEYCSNGYGYSYMYKGERCDDAFYFPQAPLNVLANVTVKF